MGSAGNAAAKNRQVESVVVVEVSCGNKPGKPDQLIPSAPESAVAVAEQDLNPPDAETLAGVGATASIFHAPSIMFCWAGPGIFSVPSPTSAGTVGGPILVARIVISLCKLLPDSP